MTAKAKKTVTVVHITAKGNYSTTSGGSSVKPVSAAKAKKAKVTAKKAKAAKAKKVALSPGDVPLCAAEAVAAHRLLTTGYRMSDAEVLALLEQAGGEDGALIPDTLEAAGASFWPAEPGWGVILGVQMPEGRHAVVPVAERVAVVGRPHRAAGDR